MNDFDVMKKACQLALKGRGRTSPNPMVGAVVVKGGKVIAEGYHRHCGGPHAEIVAMRKLSPEQLHGATLYVTLEPCFHHGRTPPCVEAIIKSGIREVIVGMKDPNPLTHGKSLAKLKGAGIKVKTGVLQKELATMNEAFTKYIKTKMPFVTAKTAQTLDGKIATATGQSQWITSERSRKHARRLRNDFDAIMVGVNTILKDNPGLNADRPAKRLKKIVLDSSLRTPFSAKIFTDTAPEDCLIAVTARVEENKVRALQKKSVSVMVCPEKDGHVDLRWLMAELARREIANILIEGGAHVIGCALKDHLVDKMLIFIAPKIIGDQAALSSVVGCQTLHVDHSMRLIDTMLCRLGEDILLEGHVVYPQDDGRRTTDDISAGVSYVHRDH